MKSHYLHSITVNIFLNLHVMIYVFLTIANLPETGNFKISLITHRYHQFFSDSFCNEVITLVNTSVKEFKEKCRQIIYFYFDFHFIIKVSSSARKV